MYGKFLEFDEPNCRIVKQTRYRVVYHILEKLPMRQKNYRSFKILQIFNFAGKSEFS